jgi:pilus assembly protein CpaB
VSRRRRGLLLGGLALLLGGLAASEVSGREAALRRSLGPLVPIVVAREPVGAGAVIGRSALGVRSVPQRFAPRGAYPTPRLLEGVRAAVAIPAGADLTPAMVQDAGGAGPRVRPGERVAELVALGSPELILPGSRVDVLVTRETGSGGGETRLALQDAEVLAARPAEDGDARSEPGRRVSVSLRVTLRQAVYLAAAQSFARELRVLPRATGDRGRAEAGTKVDDDLG